MRKLRAAAMSQMTYDLLCAKYQLGCQQHLKTCCCWSFFCTILMILIMILIIIIIITITTIVTVILIIHPSIHPSFLNQSHPDVLATPEANAAGRPGAKAVKVGILVLLIVERQSPPGTEPELIQTTEIIVTSHEFWDTQKKGSLVMENPFFFQRKSWSVHYCDLPRFRTRVC